MLEAGANVNAKDENGNTALMEAAAWGRAIIVKFLVDSAGGDVNLTNREGFTALIKAAAGGHTDVVRYLTQVFGTDVNATTMFGDSAAALAAQYGHTDLAQYLVVECQAVLDTTKLRAAVDRRDDVARYLAEGGASRVNASNANAIGGEVRRAAQDRRSAPSIDAWSSALAQAAVDGNVYGLRRIVGSSRVNVNVNATVHDGDTALMKAAGFGHFAVVRYLVAECGADVNIANYRGITALMRADTEEHLDIVRYLTRECGADVNATDSGEATILMRVAAKGRLAVVQCLVEDCGARVNAIDWYGETALLKAAGERHLDVVRYLAVKCGADVNTISSRGVTALMEAASKGSIDVVRCLAEECGASVDVVNGSGTSAVMLAAQSGQLHVVRYLAVECRANVNATDKNGDTALLGAALQGHFDTARFLAVNCEADLDVTALTKAAARGCFYAVRFLVEERRVDTSATDISGATVLMTAAQHGHIHIVRYLVVTRKGDVNVADKYGDTPLTKASANGHFDVVRALVREYGADVSTTNNTGTTPLMLAAQHGHVDIVRYLAGEHAVDVNAADISGTNALMIAAQYGHIGVVHYLAGDRGADANATNSTRTTALMIAAQYGNMDVVRHLATQYRANVNAANADGYTAMRFAAERGHEEIQRFLTRFLVVHQAGGPETRTARSVPSDATVNNTPSWFIPPSEISLVSFVETGNIGGEYQAKWLDADAAVKLFVPDASSHVGFEHEVHFWHRLRHPNVIKMYGACDASPLPLQFFVCEYASNGSLLEYTKLIPPEEQRVWTFLHQAALGLEYLHEREIIHGDLRCSNILIGSDGLAKLANFARSNSMHQIRHGATLSRVGSVRWQPPEVLKREALSFASDVYSLGMCILEAVTKGVPWKDIGTDYMLGSGGFGSVFRAKWLDSEVVVKVLIKSGAAFDVSCTSLSYTGSSSSVCQSAATTANAKKREETMAVFRREVDIWFRLSHPHVVRLFGACHVGRPFFVCEFATNGTLVSYLRKHPDELWAKLHEAALDVQYLHARNVVHGDLKGNNIVIGSDKKAKVTDFGLSAITNDGVDPRISGASHWVAPECFINELARPNFESDIYALGMCIVEALRVVAAGEDKSKPCLPWGALDNFVARCHATQGQLPEKPPLCTDDQWKLVQRMCVRADEAAHDLDCGR
ncbi:hypothetical protein PR003_g7901 [Phytophthora rubi]|uniref:Protein kinase domain-containing protein n=1 Tax=Phytophthora rubi TaxID=129364 RepID=A0A6A4FKL0_9STRA|nr:hypothetical protein PR003_g7901 [Phytophthora rubi]